MSKTAIPNELFSYELRKRHWTAVNVAVKIGVPDENTVGRWKRGEAVPSDYYKEKLEELFGKKIDKLGWPDENKIPNQNLDYHPPTPLFTGREDILSWLYDGLALRGRYDLLSVQALTGLSGVGKSQIASKYAHKFIHEYHTIMWLSAENSAVLALDFAAIASYIGLPEQYETNQQKRIDAVIRWLTHKEITRWLLIFDSADDPEIIKEILHRYIPHPCQGHVILTTRSSATGLIEQRKEVNPLSVEESVHFLLRRAKLLSTETNNELAKTMAELLGGLPLVLEQAGAYIEETRCSLARYLDLYQTTARKRLLRYKGNVTDHEPIAIILELTFDQVHQENPLAYDLLSLFAFCAPDHIPEVLVRKGASALSPALQSIAEHPYLLEDAVGELLRYSLIRRSTETETCSIHLLVQTCMKDTMDEETQKLWAERAVKAIFQIISGVALNFAPYFSHVQMCLELIIQFRETSPEATRLLHLTGTHLLKQAKFHEAEPLLQEAHSRYEIEFGSNHYNLIPILLDLGQLYIVLLRYSLAEDLLKQALAIAEQVFGSIGSTVSQCLIALEKFNAEYGSWGQAALYHDRRIDLDNLTFHVNGLDRVMALSNLSQLYEDLGRYEEAAPLREQAIEIIKREAVFMQSQRHHPDYQVADTQFETKYLDVIALSEWALGNEHPYTRKLYYLLSRIYFRSGRYIQAEELYLKSRSKLENALLADNLSIAAQLAALGFLHSLQGRYEEAWQFYVRSTTIEGKVLATDEIDTAETLLYYAIFYSEQERFLEAKQLFQQSLIIYDKAFGVNHPNTVFCREKYIALLRSLEMYNEAEKQKKLVPRTDVN